MKNCKNKNYSPHPHINIGYFHPDEPCRSCTENEFLSKSEFEKTEKNKYIFHQLILQCCMFKDDLALTGAQMVKEDVNSFFISKLFKIVVPTSPSYILYFRHYIYSDESEYLIIQYIIPEK